MLFNSFYFLIFYPTTVIIFFILPARFRGLFLLLAGYYFYMVQKPEYLAVILVSTFITWLSGLAIEKAASKKKALLILSLVMNFGILFFFKYIPFLSKSVSSMLVAFKAPWSIPYLSILLPLGISFYTFQAASYTIDVYRGLIRAERNLLTYALFISFFPKLLAGPIERASNLMPQFVKCHRPNFTVITDGLKLMAWGVFKKVVIADRLALIVDKVFTKPTDYQGLTLILATVFYTFQIYCDFSGYTDIALGSAQVMGFRLMDNFNRPYSAVSIADFWRRWHISLSSWLRDYVYIPLGGNRVLPARHLANIAITFLVCGIWHGANWTFVVWGALHGLYLISSIVTEKTRRTMARGIGLDRYPAFHRCLKLFTTFCLVAFAWVFFRAESLGDAWYIVTHLFSGFDEMLRNGLSLKHFIAAVWSVRQWVIMLSLLAFMSLIHRLQSHDGMRHMFKGKPVWFRWSFYYILLMLILCFGVFEAKNQFIYFEF